MIFLHLFLTIGNALQNLQLLDKQYKYILQFFFHSVAPAIQLKMNFSCKSFNNYVPFKNYDYFTISPTSKAEFDAIISSLNSDKLTDPDSILLNVLITQNEISQHLVDIFNLSFKTGAFPKKC